MKTFSLFFLSIALLVPVSLAGNFGPAPFRNGSPLVSGVDGTYQATARSENVTGIFRFAYSGGSQTANTSQNSWIFFRQGQVSRGTVDAAIDGSNLSGILGEQQSQSVGTNQANSFPIIIVSSDAQSLGTFNGKLQLKSPNGAFSGSGIFQSAAPTVTVYNLITTNNFPGIVTNSLPFTNSNSVAFTNSFSFRGVRTSTSSSSTTSTNTTSN